jgi:hypothetical protein
MPRVVVLCWPLLDELLQAAVAVVVHDAKFVELERRPNSAIEWIEKHAECDSTVVVVRLKDDAEKFGAALKSKRIALLDEPSRNDVLTLAKWAEHIFYRDAHPESEAFYRGFLYLYTDQRFPDKPPNMLDTLVRAFRGMISVDENAAIEAGRSIVAANELAATNMVKVSANRDVRANGGALRGCLVVGGEANVCDAARAAAAVGPDFGANVRFAWRDGKWLTRITLSPSRPDVDLSFFLKEPWSGGATPDNKFYGLTLEGQRTLPTYEIEQLF